MIEQVLVTVLVIAVAFGAESEFKFRIGKFGSAADGAFMFGYALRGSFSSDGIPKLPGPCGSLHSLSG